MSASQDEINNRIFEKLDALTSMMHEMRIELVEMRTELRLRKECPDPGACLTLKTRVEQHEEMIQQAKGGWRVLVGATLSSGLLGAFFSHWISKR